jgi:hypothetical protein
MIGNWILQSAVILSFYIESGLILVGNMSITQSPSFPRKKIDPKSILEINWTRNRQENQSICGGQALWFAGCTGKPA